MKRIRYWFTRKKVLMAQAKDLARQLQEAWDKTAHWEAMALELEDMHDYVVLQLHRVARERDAERNLRLDAEDMLLDSYLRRHEIAEEDAAAERYYNEEE